ncbi:hypothetical protein BJ322DRAFT_1046927 [Thelephora terrestris]|uniref:Uncharacterized protein n=1 Tax=Thelephora terrestris TaxID=56493 RepID=A0A9P6L939_9AGAM|nr:hypothetical protein BJ322DRAFT_1046927 [Thelephora terrestris]
MNITIRLELQYQGDKARKMNHDRDPGHRVLPWSPYDPTRSKLPEDAFSWRRMLDNDLKALEFGHPETVNYVKQSAKIFCNYVVEENGPAHRSLCARIAQLEKPTMRAFKENICLKYVKIMSSRYERRRERDSEPDERTQRSISPGPPRKRSRTDAEQPGSRLVYQRPRSPSPQPQPSTPRYPAATTQHKPSETPTPSVRPHQDDRNKLSPRLQKTAQNSFSSQTSTTPPRDHKNSSNHTPAPQAPLKLSSALATLSSSTALSSMLSRTDGAENSQRATNSISQSPTRAPAPKPTLGASATQFDLAKLHSLSQALQNHGSISAPSTDGNGNAHIPKQAVSATEPRSTHPMATERSSSSLAEKASDAYREYVRPVYNEGESRQRRASTSSRTSERPFYGVYRKESFGSRPDHPHYEDPEATNVSRRRSRSPMLIPRGPVQMRVRSPVRHPRDASNGDVQAMSYNEKERDTTWERERGWLREREQDRGREFEREWETREHERERQLEWERAREREREQERDREREREVTTALIDDARHRETGAPMTLAMDSDNMIKSLQDELASAKMALAQAREELEAEKRFSANEKQYAATCAQKYLLLRERSQLTKDTLVKAQNDFKSEKRKNEELEQVISDLQREMTSPKMVPEVLDALIKIAGMSVRVKDVLDREGYMVT